MLTKILLVVASFCFVLAQQGRDPEFLKGEPKAIVDSFHKLLANNHEHTDAQIEAKVQEWLNKQTPELKAKHDKFFEENKKREKEADEHHAASVARLSPKAKEADAKLWSLAHSPTLTNKQKQEQIDAYIETLTPAVKDEIEKEQDLGKRGKRKITKRSGSWSGERRWGWGGGWNNGWGGNYWGYRPYGWSGYGWGK